MPAPPQGAALDDLDIAPAETSGVGSIFRIGRVVALSEGAPMVTYPGAPTGAALLAATTVKLGPEQIGDRVALLFEGDDPLKPVVVGRIHGVHDWTKAAANAPSVEIDADGRRLTIGATEAIVLRCGKASLTLTAAGKVVIEGEYVTTRSNGVMRIKGGSVQIN